MPLEEYAERGESDSNEIDARNLCAVASSGVVHLTLQARQRDDALADSIRVRRHPLALGRVELVERFFDRLRIERHDRRLTIAANRRAFDVDRCAAARASNRAHARFQALQLGRIERPYEVLLAQELEERCKAPMTVTAAVIREPRRMLQIVCQREERLATRTRQLQ